MIGDRRGECLLSALLCVAIGFAWQALTVHYNRGGNWTALFLSGSQFPVPPALSSENVYVFPDSGGYDGQMYHNVAHDPMLRHGFGKFVECREPVGSLVPAFDHGLHAHLAAVAVALSRDRQGHSALRNARILSRIRSLILRNDPSSVGSSKGQWRRRVLPGKTGQISLAWSQTVMT